MNVWTEMDSKRVKPEDFIAYIEIEQGSSNKYELDKETGLIILDRVLYTATHYPSNYGFIPLTYCDDHDPLDVFVLCSKPIEKMSLVRCYPIGVITLMDRDERDDKIIAIPFGDPQYNGYKDISELPAHILLELQNFLQIYKTLENKPVEVKGSAGRNEAIKCIQESMKLFNRTFKNDE